ncbi:hypothetical protein [Paucibacter soli]|uniref:hypothetical protein n=1 Tax=Paucibacter soli TaxID=3133433 RepID=UPI0030AA0E18
MALLQKESPGFSRGVDVKEIPSIKQAIERMDAAARPHLVAGRTAAELTLRDIFDPADPSMGAMKLINLLPETFGGLAARTAQGKTVTGPEFSAMFVFALRDHDSGSQGKNDSAEVFFMANLEVLMAAAALPATPDPKPRRPRP